MSDAIAVGAMRAARERGLAVPTDLSVVGFDDVELARFADPALTTIHQPIARKGEQAVELLLAILDGRNGPDQHEILATRLVVRASTGPVPDDGSPHHRRRCLGPMQSASAPVATRRVDAITAKTGAGTDRALDPPARRDLARRRGSKCHESFTLRWLVSRHRPHPGCLRDERHAGAIRCDVGRRERHARPDPRARLSGRQVVRDGHSRGNATDRPPHRLGGLRRLRHGREGCLLHQIVANVKAANPGLTVDVLDVPFTQPVQQLRDPGRGRRRTGSLHRPERQHADRGSSQPAQGPHVAEGHAEGGAVQHLPDGHHGRHGRRQARTRSRSR